MAESVGPPNSGGTSRGNNGNPGQKSPQSRSSLSPPKAIVDTSPISNAMEQNKQSLKVKLMLRRPINQLVAQGIMPPLKTPPAFHEQRRQLERAKTGDMLKAKIQQRPARVELEQRHILEAEPCIDPSLVEKQRMLKKARLADQLNDSLSHRPGILELIQKNILHTEEPIEEAVKAGKIPFRATCEGQINKPQHPNSYLSFEEDSQSSEEAGTSPQTENLSSNSQSSSQILENAAKNAGIVVSVHVPSSTTEVPQKIVVSGTSSPANSLIFGAPINLTQVPSPASLITSTSTLSPLSPISSPIPQVPTSLPISSSTTLVSIKSPPGAQVRTDAPGKDKKKKSKNKSVPKARTIKFHEYKGPPNAQKNSITPNSSETSYELLLKQQQLFLQWQLQLQHKYPQIILPAAQKEPQNGNSPSQILSQSSAISSSTDPPSRILSKLDDLKVSDLKQELKRRNLPVSGSKPQLIERLKPFLQPSSELVTHSGHIIMDTPTPLSCTSEESQNYAPETPSFEENNNNNNHSPISNVEESQEVPMEISEPKTPIPQHQQIQNLTVSNGNLVVTNGNLVTTATLTTSNLGSTCNLIGNLGTANLGAANLGAANLQGAVNLTSAANLTVNAQNLTQAQRNLLNNLTAASNLTAANMTTNLVSNVGGKNNSESVKNADIVKEQQRQIEELQRKLTLSQLQLQQVREDLSKKTLSPSNDSKAQKLLQQHLQARQQQHQIAMQVQQIQALQAQNVSEGQQPKETTTENQNQNNIAFQNSKNLISNGLILNNGATLVVNQLPKLKLNGQRAYSLPNFLNSLPVSLISTDILGAGQGVGEEMKPPPLYEVATRKSGGNFKKSVKSEIVDDVLEILIKNGELPPSAAQDPVTPNEGSKNHENNSENMENHNNENLEPIFPTVTPQNNPENTQLENNDNYLSLDTNDLENLGLNLETLDAIDFSQLEMEMNLGPPPNSHSEYENIPMDTDDSDWLESLLPTSETITNQMSPNVQIQPIVTFDHEMTNYDPLLSNQDPFDLFNLEEFKAPNEIGLQWDKVDFAA